MADYSDVELEIEDAVAAMKAGDFDTAEVHALAAQLILSGLPVEARKEGQAAGQMRYSESMIDNFIDKLKKMRLGRRCKSIVTTRYSHDSTRSSSGCCDE